MATHALLLRGINVGPTTKLGMADLRDLLGELGHSDVRTYLRSGNVVLTPRDLSGLGDEVERAIAERFGLDVRVLVRSRADLTAITNGNPLPEAADDPARFVVVFLEGEPAPGRVRSLDPQTYEPDRFQIQGREIYQWSPNGLSKTKLTTTFWERQLGVAGTARNWKTVLALLRMLEE